jgi:hypothetical protein
MFRTALLATSKHTLRSLHTQRSLSVYGTAALSSPSGALLCGCTQCAGGVQQHRTLFTASRATLLQHKKPSRFPMLRKRRKSRSPFYFPSKDSPYYHLIVRILCVIAPWISLTVVLNLETAGRRGGKKEEEQQEEEEKSSHTIVCNAFAACVFVVCLVSQC